MQLEGLRVIDLTRILAGPFCTQLLGDLGADVIKIESPEGDAIRTQGAIKDGFSWYFAQFNRNKRSVVLDLRGTAGRAALARLIRDADVLVDNFRPGVLDDMGFNAARLVALNPRLIQASVTGYGEHGPHADRPAFDFIAQAMSGFMATNGGPLTGPLRAGLPLSDLIAGLYAALGVCAALQRRARTGQGERIGAALTDGLTSLFAFMSAEYFVSGKEPAPAGNDHPLVAPYGLFCAADGDVAIAPSNDGVYRKLLKVLGLNRLLDDPRFATNDLRMQHRAAICAEVDAVIATQPRAHWLEQLNAAGIPCGVVRGLGEAFADPQTLTQSMVIDVDHGPHGAIRMTGFPIKFSQSPAVIQRPAPALGADTQAVLRELGLTDAEIDAAQVR